MSEPKRRIIVDGVEFGQIFCFQRILRSVTASMQPQRLGIGLLTVALLVVGGKLWDTLTPHRISPSGLGEQWTEIERQEAQAVLKRVLKVRGRVQDFPNQDENEANWRQLSAEYVLSVMDRNYRDQRDVELAELDERDRVFFTDRAAVLAAAPRGDFQATTARIGTDFQTIVRGCWTLNVPVVLSGLGDLLIDLPRDLWSQARLFTILYGLYFMVVFAIGGGAIARMAAVQEAFHERMTSGDAAVFAAGNRSLILAPLMPLVVIGVMAVVPTVLGSLMNLPFLDVIGAVTYGAALLIGFIVTLAWLGYVAGASMLVPAIACERCGALDAILRVYSFVIHRPLQLLGYLVTGLIGLALGFAVVSTIAILTLNTTADLFDVLTTHSAVASAGGFDLLDLAPPPEGNIHPATHDSIAAWIMSLWQVLIISLVLSYVVVYFHSAATIVYLLMRRACDGQDIEDVWRPGLIPGTLAPLPGGAGGRVEPTFSEPAAAPVWPEREVESRAATAPPASNMPEPEPMAEPEPIPDSDGPAAAQPEDQSSEPEAKKPAKKSAGKKSGTKRKPRNGGKGRKGDG